MQRVPLYGFHGVIRGYALIDEIDVERVTAHRWHLAANGYARGVDDPLMHRLIMGLVKGDGVLVDHINGDKLDNRRANLRLGSQSLNMQNRRGPNCNSTSGYRGVSYCKRTGRWVAQATIRGHNHFLGRHHTAEDAARIAAEFRAQHMPYA